RGADGNFVSRVPAVDTRWPGRGTRPGRRLVDGGGAAGRFCRLGTSQPHLPPHVWHRPDDAGARGRGPARSCAKTPCPLTFKWPPFNRQIGPKEGTVVSMGISTASLRTP